MDFINWIFFDTIFGIATIVMATYGIVRLLFKDKENKTPEIIAGVAFFTALLTIPSIPRYQFENEIREKINQSPWMRVVNETKWGDLTEILTLFVTPVGSFTLVMPNEPTIGGFSVITFQYDEDPIESLIEPECSDETYTYSYPHNGKFVYGTEEDGSFDVVKMQGWEHEQFCKSDWSKEKDALGEYRLKQMDNNL